MMRLVDARADGGPIQVYDGDRLVGHAVTANAGKRWAVWVHGGKGANDWSDTTVKDSDAALAELQKIVDRDTPDKEEER